MHRHLRLGSSSHVTECLDRSLYPLQQTRPCNTECVGDWTLRLIGHWSDCILTTRPTTETMQTLSNDDLSQSLPSGVPSSPISLTVDGVGMLSAAQWNCGIGRRYHTTVCHNTRSRYNVSAAQCSAAGFSYMIYWIGIVFEKSFILLVREPNRVMLKNCG